MHNKRFWWSVFAVFAVTFVTSWVFHGIWLKPFYMETAQYWRTEAEMNSMMHWMWIGHFVFSWAFVWMWTKGITQDNPWHQAFRYALAFWLVAKLPEVLGVWATNPYPGGLVFRWGIVALVQALLCSFVMTWTYKPWAWGGGGARHAAAAPPNDLS